MSEQSESEKTEDPTPERIKKSREEGQVPRSRELTSLVMLLMGWGLMVIGGHHLVRALHQLLHNGLAFDRLLVRDPQHMLDQAGTLLGIAFLALLPLVGGLYLTALSAPVIIGGLNLSSKAIKFNPIKTQPAAGPETPVLLPDAL